MKEILTTQLGKANLVSVTEDIYDFAAHYHFTSGYGWEIAREGRLNVFWHGGWYGGSGLRAYNGLYPDHKVTIIVLGNLDYTDPTSIAQALEHMLFGTT